MKKTIMAVVAGASILAAAEERTVTTVGELTTALAALNGNAENTITLDASGLPGHVFDLTGVGDDSSHITLSKITLRGATEDPRDTIVAGDGTVRIFNMTQGKLQYLTISNGVSATTGGGVNAADTKPVCEHVIVTCCRSTTDGGAGYKCTWRDAQLVGNAAGTADSKGKGGGCSEGILYSCVVSNNTSTYWGAGVCDSKIYDSTIACNSNTSLGGGCFEGIASNCVIRGNRGGYGGGRYSNGGGGGVSYYLRDCLVEGNTATVNGGGLSGGHAYNCTISSNTSPDAGGGMNWGYAYDCTFEGNTAATSGGAFANAQAVERCTFRTNHANGSGGACSMYTGTMAHDSHFEGNTAGAHGGAISGGYASNCTFKANVASSYGGATRSTVVYDSVAYENSAHYGGVQYGGSWYNSTLSNNTATIGGGVYSGTISNCVAIFNSSTGGGGVSHSSCLLDSLVISNRTVGSGGAMYCSAATNCTFIGNTATSMGGAAYYSTLEGCLVAGGAALLGGAAVDSSISTCVLSNNVARRYGGATASCSLTNSVVTHNLVYSDDPGEANQGHTGGGINAGYAIDCIIEGNAVGGGVAAYQQGGGASGSALTNCILRNNFVWSATGAQAGGVGINGGSAYQCVFSNNVGGSSIRQAGPIIGCTVYEGTLDVQGQMINTRVIGYKGSNVLAVGANVYTNGIFGGQVMFVSGHIYCTNCLFVGTYTPYYFIYRPNQGKRQEFVNCTFADNTAKYFLVDYKDLSWGSGENTVYSYAGDGLYRNCIFSRNYNYNNGQRRDIWFDTDAQITFDHCLMGSTRPGYSTLYGETATVTNDVAGFTDRNAQEPYGLGTHAAARGKGVVEDWMTDATDVRSDAKFPRLRDGLVDIGCYQCWLNDPPTVILVR